MTQEKLVIGTHVKLVTVRPVSCVQACHTHIYTYICNVFVSLAGSVQEASRQAPGTLSLQHQAPVKVSLKWS